MTDSMGGAPHRLYQAVGFILATIVGMLGVAALLHMLVTLPLGDKGPEWVGAIGTVATLVGTIWLATTETRRRQKAEQVLANLHGAAMINRIELAHISVLVLVKTLAKREDVDAIEGSYYQERLDSLNALNLWHVGDLVPLVPLPHNTAAKLAQAADQLHAIKGLLAIGQDERMGATKANRINTRNAILGRASVVRLQLRDAEIECRKTRVTVGASAPT